MPGDPEAEMNVPAPSCRDRLPSGATNWRVWALAAILACVVPGMARADADGPDYYAVTGVAADDVLNVRAGPSAASAKIGEIPPDGRHLRNLGCQGAPSFAQWQAMAEADRRQAARQRWCKIRYQGIEGWVAARFVREEGA